MTRNRIRRRLREALRALKPHEGYDIVIVAQPPAAASDFWTLKSELEKLLRRAKLIAAPA